MTSPIQASVGLILRSGRALVALRPRGVRYADRWELPGGKALGREQPPETLRRELAEELGIAVVDPVPLFLRVNTLGGGARFAVHYFAVTRYDGIPSPLCAATLAWVPAPHLARLPMLDTNAPLLVRAASERGLL